MNVLTLRPYQQQAVDAVYQHLRARDDNPVVVIPTGGGKTPVMATICRDAVQTWNGRVLILAHVKELLQQSVDKLKQVCPGLPVGVYSAGLKRRDTEHAVIVAGIQSVYKRACELDAFDLILVDECHLIPADGEGMYRQFLSEARVLNPQVRVVGFTATPFRLDAGPICRDDHFLNAICFEVGVRQLIAEGFLSPLISKAGIAKADTSQLHVRAGEFVASEVEAAMDDAQLVEAACAEIAEITRDRNSVLITGRIRGMKFKRPDGKPTPKPPVVTVDSPPPPQAIVTETRFAPYERDTFAEAFAWAEAELVRKYPGSVSTLEAMKGLINQFLSAKGVKPKS